MARISGLCGKSPRAEPNNPALITDSLMSTDLVLLTQDSAQCSIKKLVRRREFKLLRKRVVFPC